MPTITSPDQLPDYAKTTADRIERLGFRWEFDYEYPVPKPDPAKRLQVRDPGHLAPKPEVTRYAAAMKRGDKFPPAVVTKDGVLVDGNTRVAAAHKADRPQFPAFIINVSTATASASQHQRLHLLGASLNTTAGLRLTRSELTDAISKVAGQPDWTPEVVAKHLGVTQQAVNSIFRQFQAEQRAARLGVVLNGGVSNSHKAEFGHMDKLTNRPWEEIVTLVRDAGLTTGELRDLRKRVASVSSEDEQVAVVQAERAAREAQIEHFTATERRKPLPSSELRKRLGFILGYEYNAKDLVELNPSTAEDYAGQLHRAIGILGAVLEAQRQAAEQAA